MSESPKVILYGFQPKSGSGKPTTSSPTWKTIIDLKILGVPYELVNLTYPEIRNDLAMKTGNKDVTVPTIEVNGVFITDSWKIAEYAGSANSQFARTADVFQLDEHFASLAGRSLFLGSPDVKAFARFISCFPRSMAAAAAKLTHPILVDIMDEANSVHYLSRIYKDPSVIDTWKEALQDPAWVRDRVREVQNNLSVIDRYLKLNSESNPAPNGELWLAGREVSHADAELFALYCGNSYSRETVDLIWDSDVLPYLCKWLQVMKDRYIKDGEIWQIVN